MFCSDITPIAILLAYPKGFTIIYSPDILVINVTNIPITPTDIGIKKDLKIKAVINSIDINPAEAKIIYKHLFIPINIISLILNLIIEARIIDNIFIKTNMAITIKVKIYFDKYTFILFAPELNTIFHILLTLSNLIIIDTNNIIKIG
jgi:hypothetical protein